MPRNYAARLVVDPGLLALEITEDLEVALAQFAAVTRVKGRPGFPIAADLKR